MHRNFLLVLAIVAAGNAYDCAHYCLSSCKNNKLGYYCCNYNLDSYKPFEEVCDDVEELTNHENTPQNSNGMHPNHPKVVYPEIQTDAVDSKPVYVNPGFPDKKLCATICRSNCENNHKGFYCCNYNKIKMDFIPEDCSKPVDENIQSNYFPKPNTKPEAGPNSNVNQNQHTPPYVMHNKPYFLPVVPRKPTTTKKPESNPDRDVEVFDPEEVHPIIQGTNGNSEIPNSFSHVASRVTDATCPLLYSKKAENRNCLRENQELNKKHKACINDKDCETICCKDKCSVPPSTGRCFENINN